MKQEININNGDIVIKGTYESMVISGVIFFKGTFRLIDFQTNEPLCRLIKSNIEGYTISIIPVNNIALIDKVKTAIVMLENEVNSKNSEDANNG